jgi:hypothetical protein
MPEVIQGQMESVFRANFSDVRIHVGPEAASIGALAFTQGSDIFFAPGQYNPTTPPGRRLLAQQLAHVVQQRSGRVRNPFGSGMAVVHDPRLKAEAELMGHRAALPQPAQPRMAGSLNPSAARHPSPAATPRGVAGHSAGVPGAVASLGSNRPAVPTPVRPGPVGMPSVPQGARLAPASMPQAMPAPLLPGRPGPGASQAHSGRPHLAAVSPGAILPSRPSARPSPAPNTPGRPNPPQPAPRLMMAFGSAVHRGRQWVQAAFGSVGRRIFGS